MKLLVSIVLVLSSLPSIGQWVTRYSYHNDDKSKLKEIFHVRDTLNNVLEGPYRSFYLNGNIESKGQFSNNETVGVWEFYYETGKLKMRGALRNNSNYGNWEYFYENGNKQMEGKIINRKREGPWKMYYESGELKNEGSFDQNKRTGHWMTYFEDGKLKGEIEYLADKGKYIEYYHTGEKKAEGPKSGLHNTGLWTYFYENGAKQAEGSYTNGNRIGEWVFYFPNGQVSSKGRYEGDKPSGEWTYFYETGELNTKGEFEEGEKQGVWNAYYPNGKVKSSTAFTNENGVFTEYYENGQLKASGTLIDNVKHGTWEYYYSDGSLEGEVTFDHGRGKYAGYYKDGTLQTTGMIVNDHRIGSWELYDQSGTLKGYYKPFYENDSLKLTDIIESKKEKPVKKYGVADFGFKPKKFSYFKPKMNEFHGMVLSINPLTTFIGRLPIAGEIYLQERLGYEILLEAVRAPFYKSNEKVSENSIYTRGYMIALRQKFYNPDDWFGLFYFGHSLSYSNYDHFINLLDMDSQMSYTSTAKEIKYIYRIILGYRIMERTYSKGFTADGYVGLGTGYRKFDVQGHEEDNFNTLSHDKIPLDFSFGILFGYVYPFKRKR